jgi:hypothetical protein
MTKPQKEFDDERRRDEILRRALNTPPKPKIAAKKKPKAKSASSRR